MELNGCYRTKVNSKAFTIPIVTAVVVKHFEGRSGQNRDSKCFRINHSNH